jgi:hypothetical protein
MEPENDDAKVDVSTLPPARLHWLLMIVSAKAKRHPRKKRLTDCGKIIAFTVPGDMFG